MVDDKDFERISSMKWTLNSPSSQWPYARSFVRQGVYISMHRMIVDCPDGLEVDHINGNTLDNRRCNLRVCTHAENMRNRKINKDNKSGYKGVYLDKKYKTWRAQIKVSGQKRYLGSYKTAEAAAEAYRTYAEILHKEFARF